MKGSIFGLCLMFAIAPACWAEPPALEPRSDSYDVQWGNLTLGRGTISLTALDKDCYRYESTTRPIALVRWTYGSPRETSEFCVSGGQILARHFEYHNDRRAKDNYTLDFDWGARTVKAIKGGNLTSRELTANSFDRFVMQLAVRLWVIRQRDEKAPQPQDFTMVDDDRMKAYRFAIIGHETVDVPAGRFDTIRVERIDNPEKSTRFWVAPERGHIPVRIEHIENGEVKLRMVLRS